MLQSMLAVFFKYWVYYFWPKYTIIPEYVYYGRKIPQKMQITKYIFLLKINKNYTRYIL